MKNCRFWLKKAGANTPSFLSSAYTEGKPIVCWLPDVCRLIWLVKGNINQNKLYSMQKLVLLKAGFISTNGHDINTYLYSGFMLNKGKVNSSEMVGLFFFYLSNRSG
jgi:hypothetical protein